MGWIRSIIPIVLALILVSLPAWPQSPSPGPASSGCPIKPPQGWVAIPREALDAYQKEIAKTTPHGNAPKYDCGFQPSQSSGWMTYPFIVAYVQETGPIPEDFVLEMTKIPVSETASDWEETFRKTIQEFKPGLPLWDAKARIVWLKTDMEIGAERKISTLSGMKLTDNGFIFVAGAALDYEYARYAPIFMRAIGSIPQNPTPPTKQTGSTTLPESFGNESTSGKLKMNSSNFKGLNPASWPVHREPVWSLADCREIGGGRIRPAMQK